VISTAGNSAKQQFMHIPNSSVLAKQGEASNLSAIKQTQSLN
jgi:hypothetical protein